MNESGKHTGWHIDAGDEWRQPRVLDWSGKVVAVLPEESNHGNLIAAAPDMLAALLRIVTEERAPGLFAASMPHDMREMARAALTKAGSQT